MSSQRLDPKVIRYSQSSITGRFHQGRNICDVTSDFIADVYDRNEFIRCVRYPSEEYTSYDNKRLYWAREQPILSCTVCDADTGCFEDGRLAVLYWESENSKDNGSPKRLHKATVIARDYGAWIALKCSRQGPDFPLCGRLQLPTVSNRSISSELPLYRLCGTMKPITEESEIGNCIRDLKPHLAKKGSIYVGMPNGTLLYSNENWPAYLQGSGFENHFKCVMYETYLNIYIKTLGADKEKWDVADREAYDFEVQGLTELDDVSSEDSDDESWESEEEQRTLNNFGSDVHTKTAQEGSATQAISTYSSNLCGTGDGNQVANSVNLSFKGLLRITDEWLAKAPVVEILDLSGNRGFQLGEEIAKFVNLTQLSLRDCTLNHLPDEIMQLTKLQELDLSRNPSLLFPQSIAQLRQLRKLSLFDCGISELPEVMKELQDLEDLVLVGNPMKSFPKSLTQLGRLKRLNLSKCALLELTDAIGKLTSLKKLDVHGNVRLTHLPSCVGHLSNLKTLDVSNCGIVRLPDEIGSLEKLQELDISRNRELTRLPQSISNLKELRSFRALECDLSEPPGCLAGLTKLEMLLIGGNKNLELIVPAVTKLDRLKSLHAWNCSLSSLPDGMEALAKLQEVDLSRNPLLLFPEFIARLRHLRKLSLFDCGISELPEVMEKLQDLQDLDLAGNPIKSFPKSLIQLRRLKRLNLSNCALSELTDAIGNLTSLEELDINGNVELTHLPSCVGHLSNLRILDVSDCRIFRLPDEIRSLEKLEELRTYGNPSLDILPSSMSGLRSLKILDVSFCQLSDFPKAVGKLSELVELHARENPLLATLPPTISGLKKLKMLDISTCAFIELPNAVGMLSALEYLDIHENQLTSFPNAVLSLKKLRFLDLSNRPNPVKQVEDDQNPVEKGEDEQTPVEMDYDEQNPVEKDGDEQNPVEKDDDEQNPVEKDDDEPNPVEKDDDEQNPVEKDDDEPNPVEKDDDEPNPVEKDDDEQNPVEKDDDEQNPVDRDYDEQNPVEMDYDEQNPVEKDYDEQNPAENKDDDRNVPDYGIRDWFVSQKGNSIKELPVELTDNKALAVLRLEGNPMIRPPVKICQRGLRAIQTYLRRFADVFDQSRTLSLSIWNKAYFSTRGILGQGGFGIVKANYHPQLGLVAVKMDRRSKSSFRGESQCTLREIGLLACLHHENIIGFFGCIYDSNRRLLVFELAEHRCLRRLMDSLGPETIPISIIIRILYQVALAMHYLHSPEIEVLHLNLKASKVLITSSLIAKISGFEIMEWDPYGETETTLVEVDKIRSGTRTHEPPEILLNIRLMPGRKFDVYSYAILMWESLSGRDVDDGYGAADFLSMKEMVIGGVRPRVDMLRSHADRRAQELMEKCWHADYHERPNFKEIVGIMEKIFRDNEIDALADEKSLRKAISNNPDLTDDLKKPRSVAGDLHQRALTMVKLEMSAHPESTNCFISYMINLSVNVNEYVQRMSSCTSVRGRAAILLSALRGQDELSRLALLSVLPLPDSDGIGPRIYLTTDLPESGDQNLSCWTVTFHKNDVGNIARTMAEKGLIPESHNFQIQNQSSKIRQAYAFISTVLLGSELGETELPLVKETQELPFNISEFTKMIKEGQAKLFHELCSSDNVALWCTPFSEGMRTMSQDFKEYHQTKRLLLESEPGTTDVWKYSADFDERGGMHCFHNEVLTLFVPSGALKDPTKLYVEVLGDHWNSEHGECSMLLECGPPGLCFAKPIELIVSNRAMHFAAIKYAGSETYVASEVLAESQTGKATIFLSCL